MNTNFDRVSERLQKVPRTSQRWQNVVNTSRIGLNDRVCFETDKQAVGSVVPLGLLSPGEEEEREEDRRRRR